jgi:hypothetical protein
MKITKKLLEQEFPNNEWFGGICEFIVKHNEFDVPSENYHHLEKWILQVWPKFDDSGFWGTITLKVITNHPTSGQQMDLKSVTTLDELLNLLDTFQYKKQ